MERAQRHPQPGLNPLTLIPCVTRELQEIAGQARNEESKGRSAIVGLLLRYCSANRRLKYEG